MVLPAAVALLLAAAAARAPRFPPPRTPAPRTEPPAPWTPAPGAPAAAPSSGCGGAPPATPGATEVIAFPHGGLRRTYRLHLPSGYDAGRPAPLVLGMHSFQGSGVYFESHSGLSDLADRMGFIIAYPEGWGENPENGKSWRAVGTVDGPGPLGPTCAPGQDRFCYDSCAARAEGCRTCDWTTCVDDEGFVAELHAALRRALCVDLARQYIVGHSNGALMTWRLAATLPGVAAAVAISGSPMLGYTQPPLAPPVSILVIHGYRDTTWPANATAPYEWPAAAAPWRWFYSPVNNLTAAWAAANGCPRTDGAAHYPTRHDGTRELWCADRGGGACRGGTMVVRCTWNGQHNLPDLPAGAWMADTAWAFLRRFARPPTPRGG